MLIWWRREWRWWKGQSKLSGLKMATDCVRKQPPLVNGVSPWAFDAAYHKKYLRWLIEFFKSEKVGFNGHVLFQVGQSHCHCSQA